MSDDARTDAVERVRADLDRGFLPSVSAMRSTVAQVDRLRAQLAETWAELHGATGAAAVLRERGDALADAKNWVGHVVEAERWRSVRGDAPAAPAGTFNAELRVAPAAVPTDGRSAVGRCGAIPPPLSGIRAVAPLCELDAGHAGWHRDGSTEWGPVAPTYGQAPAAADERDEIVRLAVAWRWQWKHGSGNAAAVQLADAVDRLSAAPADDTAPATPFTVDQEVRSVSGVRGTVRVANHTYSLVTWSNGNVVWVRNDEFAPADDTAPAPGGLRGLLAKVGVDVEGKVITVDGREVSPEQPGPADDTAAPDAPDVWDHCTAPGGYVCGTCGTPTESEPCAEHQPTVAAGIDAAPRLCPRHGVAEPHQNDDGWDCGGGLIRDSQPEATAAPDVWAEPDSVHDGVLLWMVRSGLDVQMDNTSPGNIPARFVVGSEELDASAATSLRNALSAALAAAARPVRDGETGDA